MSERRTGLWWWKTWCIPPYFPQSLGCSLHLASARGWWPPPGSPCRLRRTSPDHTLLCYYPCRPDSLTITRSVKQQCWRTIREHMHPTRLQTHLESFHPKEVYLHLDLFITMHVYQLSHTLRFIPPDLLYPDEWVVKLWIYRLQVFESQWLVQNTLVEGEGETCVDEFAMEQGLERSNEGGSFECHMWEQQQLHDAWIWWRRIVIHFSTESWPNLWAEVMLSPSLAVTNTADASTNGVHTMAMKRPMNLKYLRWSGLM